MSKVIVLDPGHGGSDPGAVGNGLREKDLTLDICKRVKKYLESNYTGIKIHMTRTNDKYLSLSQRAQFANSKKADLFVSVHVNAGGGTGFESFIYNGSVSSKTRTYQNTIHAEIMKQLAGVRDRGKKRANFAVVRQTKMPAILTENLFIDTKSDAQKLKDSKFINKIAQGHANGIVKALGLKKKPKPTTTKTDKNTFYRVVAGSYNDRKNADAQLAKLKKAGFDAFIDVYKK